MKFRYILISALICVMLALAGCGESESPAPADSAAPAAASSPVDGDALVSAGIGEPSNLIPALANDSSSTEIT
ncbi:MAG: peptide-binding protein, partial [Candidatus Adiutrix sp.]|nr:peptide-binding protein [Candidatus Adiutrix sp.]